MVAVLYQALDEDWLITLRCDRRREALKSKPPCTLVPQVLHVPSLIASYGPDLPIGQLVDKLRCPKCGSKRVAIDVVRSIATRRPRSMQPAAGGQPTLGASPEPWLVFECPRCGRRGEYRRERMVEEFGASTLMPSLLLPFAAKRGCVFAQEAVARPDLTRPPECQIRYVVEQGDYH